MEKMILSVPVIGLIGLLFAFFLRLHVIKQDRATTGCVRLRTPLQKAPGHL